MPRWTQRPPGSTWGDFGPDDRLGRLNLLTPARIRAAAAEVVEGRRFGLSLPLDVPGEARVNKRRGPPVLRPTEHDGVTFMDRPLGGAFTDVVCDDQVTMALQYSTQWDSFAHVGSLFDADGDGVAEPVYYNGHGSSAGVDAFAATPIQGRGVLVDLRAHLGDGRTLVGGDELARILAADGVVVEAGDLVLFHTGYADALLAMDRHPDMAVLNRTGAVLDGRDPRLLDWVGDTGVAALCADNYAVEAYPARPGAGRHAALPLHEHCLFKLGVPLGELWFLSELAGWLRAHGRRRFLLTAPPLRLPGAVGSPVTPVATV